MADHDGRLQAHLVRDDHGRGTLIETLAKIDADPYRHVEGFRPHASRVAAPVAVPAALRDFSTWWRRAGHDSAVAYVENAPVDITMPTLGREAPSGVRHTRKHADLAAGFLALMAGSTRSRGGVTYSASPTKRLREAVSCQRGPAHRPVTG